MDKNFEINIYYASDMLYFGKIVSEAEIQDICGNIMAQKPAILVCFGLCLVTKRPRLLVRSYARSLICSSTLGAQEKIQAPVGFFERSIR